MATLKSRLDAIERELVGPEEIEPALVILSTEAATDEGRQRIAAAEALRRVVITVQVVSGRLRDDEEGSECAPAKALH